MNCADLRELLSAYSNGELARTQRELVQEHLDRCSECREAMANFAEVRQLLSTLQTMPLSIGIGSSTMAKINKETLPKCERSAWKAALLAGMIFTLLIGLSLGIYWIDGGKPDYRALAAEVAKNDVEIQTTLDTGRIEVLRTQIRGGQGLVICGAEMKPLVVANVNLQTKRVDGFNELAVPSLNEDEKTQAIDIAEAGHFAVANQAIAIFPFFDLRARGIASGQGCTFLPNPTMALIEIVDKEKGNKGIVIDLTTDKVIQVVDLPDIAPVPPTIAPMSPTEVTAIMKSIDNESGIKGLLDKGAYVDSGHWVGTGTIGYVIGENDEMTTAAWVSKDRAVLALRMGEGGWNVDVEMATGKVQIVSNSNGDFNIKTYQLSPQKHSGN